MSRTEGVSLPRLPTSHVRVTSPKSIQPHSRRQNHHRRSVSEPSYTAYVGTPRQDIPHHVYHDAAMFDDVFDKQGKLLLNRNTPKITAPLNSIGYSSLHDPNCKKLFLNNKKLRSHLMNLGLITDDLRVVASTSEQRQKIRAHELLERKEQLLLKLEDQEQKRIERLQRQIKLPRLYQESFVKAEERKVRAEQLQQMKAQRMLKAEQDKREWVKQRKEEEKRKLQQAMESAKLNEQAKRNAFRAQQEVSEMRAYERQYGKFGTQIANWHRESDRLHNRMVIMERKYWSRIRQQKWLSESYPPPLAGSHSSSSASSDVDVEETLHTSTVQPLSQQSGEDIVPPVVDTTVASLDEQPAVGMEEHETKVVEMESSEPQVDTGGEILQGNGLPDDDDQLQETAVEDEIKKLTISERGHHNMEETEELEQKEYRVESQKIEDAQLLHEDGHLGPAEDTQNKTSLKERQSVPEVVTLNPDQSSQELSRILIDAFSQSDVTASGFINLDDFIQVLNSRDLGLQLNENELVYLAEQADINKNGWIPFVQVTPHLPPLLLAIYSQRADLSVQHFGAYVEEQWCQLYGSGGTVIYFNKLTGVMQLGGRPDDFRPYLKDDVFEDSIVDFFETADSNKDGIVDYNDFYSLLISPMVSTRIYSNQMEDLLALYQNYSTDDRMDLENFAPVAKNLLLMIYQNTYLDVDEWIELESRKSGTFWFNKINGETFLPQSSVPAGGTSGTGDGMPSSTAPNKTANAALSKKRKKKYSRRVSWDDDPSSSQPAKSSAPPPLRRRQSKAKQSKSLETTEGERDTSVSTAAVTVVENDRNMPKTVDSESEIRQDHDTVVESAAKDEVLGDNKEVKSEVEPSSQTIEDEAHLQEEQTTESQITETTQNKEQPSPEHSQPQSIEDEEESATKPTQNEKQPVPEPNSQNKEGRSTEIPNEGPAHVSDVVPNATGVTQESTKAESDAQTEDSKTGEPADSVASNKAETQDNSQT